ncbi:MAG: parallel beta-helix domain-containing protein [Bacteroidia bacterium]|nr:parallel beta-helix domain-containing protein [Bacteroidia bacterium]
MKIYLLLLISFFGIFSISVGQNAVEKEIQTRLILAEDGERIQIPEGTHSISKTLSLDEKTNVIIEGAGMDKSTLTFKSQKEGAEGLRITNSKNIIIRNLTIQDASGDNIKAMNVDGISFENVKVEWTGKPKKTNGAYGIYPVSCKKVLIDGCEAIGASDAGIYVGQSHDIVVRNSRAYRNVAGIEIENSTLADVYNCEATENTGGILVFDLPDLPKKKGGNVRVYKNKVYNNNYKNFAPKGNIVGTVPPGTGIMILATNNVEVYDNEISNNRTAGTSIVSYFMSERKINDKEYYPYPTGIYIHDNSYERERKRPTFKSKIGLLLFSKFKKDVPDILYDGIIDPETLNADGTVKDEYKICIVNNKGAKFANLDAENDFKGISKDMAPHDCGCEPLKAPTVVSR